MRSAHVVVSLLALAGGAAPAPAAAPWIEVRAAGFTVVSDASEKEAAAVLGQLAEVRGLVRRAWPWARTEPGRPVVILVARDESGLASLLPEYWEKKGGARPAGVFVRAPDRNWVVLRLDAARDLALDGASENPYQNVFHDYVHLLVRLNVEGLPPWLDEGLAEYWGSTVRAGGRTYQGRFIGGHIQTLRQSTLVPVSRLFSASGDEISDANRAGVAYAQSWALVHYLTLGTDQRRGQIQRLAELLRDGRPAEEAFREAFGDVEALGRELDAYVRRDSFPTVRIPPVLEAGTGPVTTRALTEAEVLALRSAFHVATGRPTEAAARVADALRLDPGSAAAHEALALAAWRGGHAPDALAAIEKAVAAPGASDYAWFLHGRLLLSRGEHAVNDRAVASLRRALELNPAFAGAADALAQALDANGAFQEAVPFAARAAELEPAVVAYRVTALRASAHAGAVRESREQARQLLGRARADDRRLVEDLLAEISDPRRLPPEVACADGHAPSCLELGRRYRTGKGVAADPARAAALFETACKGGQAEGCSSLGWMLEEGTSAPKDLPRALGLYRLACDAGERWSCARVGVALVHGDGVARDPVAARALLQRACDAGETSACASLGSLLRLGEGGPRDSARAESLLRTACDGGSGWACSELGDLELGRGTAASARDAAALYERACASGSALSCALLAQLHEAGHGVARDPARARSLYAAACDGGYAAACAKAAPAAAGTAR